MKMNTLMMMIVATTLFVTCNVVCAQTAAEARDELIEDCLSDYTIDWEDERCDFMRPEGDQEYVYDDEYDEHELVGVIE